MANTKNKNKLPEKEAAVAQADVRDVERQNEERDEKPIVPKEIDLNMTVTVYNGFNGKLTYVSQRTGEVFRWGKLGDEQDIELKELKSAKNTKKGFFENNWFMFNEEDSWVINYLGLDRYYANAIHIDKFDDLLTSGADNISKVVSKMSKGQKNSLSYRARELVADGTIDSRKSIDAIEKCLGIELIEK